MANISRSITLLIYCLFIAPLLATPLYAASNDWATVTPVQPGSATDPVLLIEGKLKEDKQVQFDLQQLLQFPSTSFVVTHPTSGEKKKYTGIHLNDFLNHIGIAADAKFLVIRASNDYKAAIRMSDIRQYDYLLSYKQNETLYDQLPPEQNRGPLAIAINFDKHPMLDYDIYKHQLVWFVEKITVK